MRLHFTPFTLSIPGLLFGCVMLGMLGNLACGDDSPISRGAVSGHAAQAAVTSTAQPSPAPQSRPAQASGADMTECAKGTWSTVKQSEELIALVFGDGAQFGAVHKDSSYVRFVPTRGSGWGTSLILAPAFWRGGVYYQATAIAPLFEIECERLRMRFSGRIGELPFEGTLTLEAPDARGIAGRVEVVLGREWETDPRPGESFKLAMLSSMRVAEDVWDTRAAHIDGAELPLPAKGFIVKEPASSRRFGLLGGNSAWKARAPTVMIELEDDLSAGVTGWVTASRDPNDDNVGMWIATTRVPRRWSYRFELPAAD